MSILQLLKDCQEELRLIRTKDGAGPYDVTIKSRLETAIYKMEQQDAYSHPVQSELDTIPSNLV